MQNYQGYFMNNGMYQQPMYQAMGLNGRVVDNFNMITANDVPMDNFGAIFVKVDGADKHIRKCCSFEAFSLYLSSHQKSTESVNEVAD